MSEPRPIAKIIDAAGIGARAQPASEAESPVKRLFLLFHGYYGALFLSRYQTGDDDLQGKDRGVKSAMKVWQAELAHFEPQDIEAAAMRCKADHPDFPPTLPQFLALCKAVRVRQPTKPNGPGAIEMSGELRSSYTAKARAEAMHRYRANLAAEVGKVETEGGIRGMQTLIAQAVALAGGDEVAILRRFDQRPIVRYATGRAA